MTFASAKSIALIISVMMPQDVPDINHVERMQSFDDCWAAARAFVEKDLSEELRSHGAVGLKATCGYMERPSSTD